MSPRSRWFGAALALLGAGQAMAAPPVPQHWLDYAGAAGAQFQARLRDGANERAQRLHAWLEQRETNDRLMGVSAPVVVLTFSEPFWALILTLLAAILWLRHLGNIRRLLAGEESRIGSRA